MSTNEQRSRSANCFHGERKLDPQITVSANPSVIIYNHEKKTECSPDQNTRRSYQRMHVFYPEPTAACRFRCISSETVLISRIKNFFDRPLTKSLTRFHRYLRGSSLGWTAIFGRKRTNCLPRSGKSYCFKSIVS